MSKKSFVSWAAIVNPESSWFRPPWLQGSSTLALCDAIGQTIEKLVEIGARKEEDISFSFVRYIVFDLLDTFYYQGHYLFSPLAVYGFEGACMGQCGFGAYQLLTELYTDPYAFVPLYQSIFMDRDRPVLERYALDRVVSDYSRVKLEIHNSLPTASDIAIPKLMACRSFKHLVLDETGSAKFAEVVSLFHIPPSRRIDRIPRLHTPLSDRLIKYILHCRNKEVRESLLTSDVTRLLTAMYYLGLMNKLEKLAQPHHRLDGLLEDLQAIASLTLGA